MEQNVLYDDSAAITEILNQAPSHVGIDEAKKAYYDAKRNIPIALARLWDLPPLPEKPKPVGVNAEKWTEVRETFDELDAAVYDALGKNPNPQQNIDNSPIITSCD